MSSNCPQLQLSLQPSTNSFKRSFEEFGFDLESPGAATDAGGSGANNGNDRNKRARSASSFSESSDSMDTSHLSTIASGSSGSSPSRHEADDVTNQSTTSPNALLSASLSTHSGLEPPRLPTPDIQDIEMPDYPAEGSNSESFADSLAPQMPNPEDRYQLSIDHYNPFHGEMSGLRHPQPNPPLVSRSPTSPPILPPLYISDDQTRLSTSAIPFLHSSPPLHSTTSHVGSFFDNQSPSSIRTQSPITNRDNSIYEEQGQAQGHQHDSLFQNEFQPIHDPLEFSTNRPQSVSSSNNTTSSRSVRRAVPAARHMISTSNTTHFREHLNSALDHLRSPSPLVPGLEDIGQDTSLLQSSHVNNRISRALPNPPTLPPIVTDTDNDNWDQNSPLLDILTSQASAGSPRDTSSFTSPTTNFDSRASVSSSVSNIGLGDHPLPSPGLDDLHNWMNSSSSGSGSSHSWDISQIPAASDTADSRQESSNVVNYQGTSSSSSAGQSRADHTASTQHRASSSPIGPRPPVATSLPLRNRWFMRMSDLEGNRPSASTSTSTSISTSQSDPDSQSNLNSSSIGLYSFSLNRRSVDENAVRSLDQGFDSRLSFSARPSPPLGLSRLDYAERFRLHEAQSTEVAARRPRVSNIWIADESDPADRELQIDTTSRPTLLATALERRRTLRENLSGRTVDEPDTGDNTSTGPSPTSQAAPRATLVESRPFNYSTRDYLRHRLRTYGRPGASNSLVDESVAEVRRRADRIEVNERINEVNREDRSSRSGVGGAVGDLFESHLRTVETDLRENGMSSLGWDPLPLSRRPLGSTSDSASREDTRRLQEWTPTHWNHITWRQPSNVSHRTSYQSSLPQHNILPLPGLPSNDDMDMTFGESIGFRPTDFISSSASSNTNTRNSHVLSSSLYDNTAPSRTTGRSSDYFWLNTSRPAPAADQNSMNSSVSSELPSPTPETDIFDARYSDMVNAITNASSSTGGVQRRHSASSDDSSHHSDDVHETRSNQPYLGDPPSLPPPDLGGVFDAERHASSIAIPDESPETIFVHPPQRPLRDSSGMSSNNPFVNPPPPPSIPIQNNASSSTANNPNSNIRISYTDIRQRHPVPPSTDLGALLRRSEGVRRVNAFLEENREMARSSGSNPTTATTTSTQAQSIVDLLQRSSTLSRSHRNTTIEPTERRNYARSVPSATSEPPSTRLDPSSFTPGPFRNTVQQIFNERRHNQRRPDPPPSAPPTIPPLSFEEDDLSSSLLQQRILFQQLRRHRDAAQATTTNPTIDQDRARRERAAIAEEGVRRERMSDRLAAARGTSESNRREQSDIHRFLTQQARMDAFRIEDSDAPVSSTHRSGGHNQGGSIDALRYDGRNSLHTSQLIERFHREQANSRTRPAVTDLTESTTSTTAPVTTATTSSGTTPAGPRWPDGRRGFPHSLMRREPGRTTVDDERRSMFLSALSSAQHISQEDQRESEELTAFHSTRGRRGRFARVPPEVMFSFGRQGRRGGTFGDYVRDEDFDDSYEGLLSLSATLGDAKPKSTPASILSDLETAQYKDWATPESDQRCPICLDDYQPTDQVLKLNNCSHWLHKDCLQQWLQGARTCPVCRKSVFPISQQTSSSSSSSSSPRRAQYHRLSLQHYPFFGGPNSSGRRDHPPPPPSPPGGGTLDPV